MPLFKKSELNWKRWTEASALVIGIFVHYLGITQGQPATACIGFFVALGPFLLLEMIETDTMRRKFDESLFSVGLRLDRIDRYLKASTPDKLRVAIFDDLLIYLPVYVADAAGFLQQEGITVDFIPKGGDREVAQALCSREAHIGLCDPCMCARREFASAGNSLRVVAPLVTGGAARPITKHELRIRSMLLRGGTVSIGTYRAPSTTFVMAVNLARELTRRNQAISAPPLNINLASYEAADFTAANLGNLLDKHELVMLWDPLLTLAKKKAENIDFRLDSSSALPNDVMYSAMLVPQRLLEERPTLGVRLFRALSRATYQIYLAVDYSDVLDEVAEAATSRRSVPLEHNELRELIRNMVKQGLFPLVARPNQVHQEPQWREQLYKAIDYRRKAAEGYSDLFDDTFLPIHSTDECRGLFCPQDTFETASPFDRY